jgi:hypothetical protein
LSKNETRNSAPAKVNARTTQQFPVQGSENQEKPVFNKLIPSISDSFADPLKQSDETRMFLFRNFWRTFDHKGGMDFGKMIVSCWCQPLNVLSIACMLRFDQSIGSGKV